MLDKKQVEDIRKDFLYLNKEYKNPIVYLDNAATSQKPIQVIDSVSEFYKYENANPHRGAHTLSVLSTDVYESGREKIAKFINATDSSEVVFTRNTTESLNLLSYSYGYENLKEDDEIVISIMEHHSNLVTWQEVCKKTGAKLKYLYVDKENMQLDFEEFKKTITEKTKIFSITQASNVVGTMPEVEKMIKYVKSVNKDCICIVDSAQYIPHNKVDVQQLGCDFLVFSGHKMLSIMGVGMLYGKKELLNNLKPF